jgi:protease-4
MAKRGEKAPLWRSISLGRIISILFSIIIIFILLSFLGMIAAVFIGPVPTGNIAVIDIHGMILADDFSYGDTSSERVARLISDADENDQIKAILLDINSGGGSAVGSDEISQAVRKAEKPVVAVIREVGASGAYWVASASDKIYANRMSITGSIGVIAAYLEFARLLEDYNITYRQLTAGKYKGMGSPFTEMTEEEEQKFQDMVDKIYSYFIDAVAENRNMSREKVEEIATGEIIIGADALRMGLVDKLGTREDAIEYLEGELNITADLAEYKQKPGLYDLISAIAKNPADAATEGVSMQT